MKIDIVVRGVLIMYDPENDRDWYYAHIVKNFVDQESRNRIQDRRESSHSIARGLFNHYKDYMKMCSLG